MQGDLFQREWDMRLFRADETVIDLQGVKK